MTITVFAKFSAFVTLLGGPAEAARQLECDAGYVVHLMRGRRRPGLRLALEIERRSRRKVRAGEWAAARVDRIAGAQRAAA